MPSDNVDPLMPPAIVCRRYISEHISLVFIFALFKAICFLLIFYHLKGCLRDRGVWKNEDVYSKHFWYHILCYSIFLINVKCCSRYLLQYKRDNNNDREEKSEDYEKEVRDQINLFFESLELSITGYTISCCRDELNKIITDINFDNRQIKNVIMK